MSGKPGSLELRGNLCANDGIGSWCVCGPGGQGLGRQQEDSSQGLPLPCPP